MINYIYFFAQIVLVLGLFIMLTNSNYFRKIIGLGIFQSSVLIFYIALGKVKGGITPIIDQATQIYSNPFTHVLMLTAIVVGFATLSVGLALIYRIYLQFGTIDEHEINGN
ncbi:MAG: Na+/H+ antiporter subunit C [Rickettsiaceae bacterium]|nr:MAG: Na+/H+ antiporter subunit C [Rickettsiaceae bacterium]